VDNLWNCNETWPVMYVYQYLAYTCMFEVRSQAYSYSSVVCSSAQAPSPYILPQCTGIYNAAHCHHGHPCQWQAAAA
jgi:hypothetical protein